MLKYFCTTKMKQPLTIAIIGAAEADNEGLLKFFLGCHCHLLLLAKDQEELRRISKTLKFEKPVAGISLIDCIKEGCWEADLVVLAVPAEQEAMVVERIREVVTQKIVISMKIADTSAGSSLQSLLPNSKVVKAEMAELEDGSITLILSGEKESFLREAADFLVSLNLNHAIAA